MARIPNWGPSAGQPVPDEQWQAYMQANPPPEGASFTSGTAVQPQGSTGAILGAAAGAPSDYWTDFYKQGPANVQLPQFQTANQDQARLEQQRVIQKLQRQAAGDMGSLAQQQLAQSYGQARAQQSSLGSTMRGQGAGAAMRGIQQGQAGIQRSLPGEQQMLMLQEQQAAQALLAQMLAQQQGQDITQAAGMAGGVNQAAAMQDAMNQFYAQMGTNLATELGQIQHQRNVAQLGYDLESGDIGSRMLQRGIGAASTAAGTANTAFGSPRPGYAQQQVDAAFNGY